MKKLFIFFISIILVTGCASDKAPESVTNESTTTTKKMTTTIPVIEEGEEELGDGEESLEGENSTTTTTTPSTTTTTTIKGTTTNTTKATTKSTTKATTKTTAKTTAKASNSNTTNKTIVSEVNKEDIVSETKKYGWVARTIKSYTLVTYSDKSTEEKNVTTSTKYDFSGFNGTTSSMLSEATSNASTYSAQVNEVLKYTNQYRAEVGLPALTLDTELTKAAMVRAIEMAYANKYSHTRPNGTECFTILREMNISYWIAAENIAAGYGTPQAASNGWYNSKGHYDNMTNPDVTKIGIGYINVNIGSQYKTYWVQLFV